MMTLRARAALAALLMAAGLLACGGSSNSPNTPNPSPAPNTANPCAQAASEAAFEAPSHTATPSSADKRDPDVLRDGSTRWRVLDDLWTHRAAEAHAHARRGSLAASPGRNAADVGDVAIVQDSGNLILPPNPLDLQKTGLRFTRNASGGYDVRKVEATFRQTLGNRLTLEDDDSTVVAVPFGFPFYDKVQQSAFVNSDGNVTFEEADKSSSERNVPRLLTGPPRLAPFLADLDPTQGSGRIYVHAVADQYTVTWCTVRGFDENVSVTTQLTLLPDGTIEFKYDSIGLDNAVVGISPGKTGDFAPVNLSDAGPTAGGASAVGERFARRAQVDVVSVAQEFYRSHPDNYDQLVIWSDQTLITDAFAYETTVANEVRGLGLDVYDLSREFGSSGRLRSLLMMDWLGKYPDNPADKVLGENTTLSVLGQEAGHRWLVFFDFRDHNGRRSDALLGRDLAHWSFFFDSDASVMEGNDIEDRGGGSFRTSAAVQRFSRLDQYAMGLVGPEDVPPFFYVENPTNVVPARQKDSAPRVGVTFNGTRRDVLIQDIIAIHGPRVPSAAEAAKVHRQAFIYLVSAGRSVDPAQVAKLDRIRREWEAFFLEATEGRMTAVTTLR